MRVQLLTSVHGRETISIPKQGDGWPKWLLCLGLLASGCLGTDIDQGDATDQQNDTGVTSQELTLQESNDVATPNVNVVTCGSRTDWFRLWTQFHGFPICYANNGRKFYGDDPPNTTWTTWGFCSGNNSGTITYYVTNNKNSKHDETFLRNECRDFSTIFGHTVEVQEFTITGR